MNVVNYHNDKIGGFKSDKELGLDNIVNINFDKNFKLLIIQPFQDIKTSNIEKLDKMR